VHGVRLIPLNLAGWFVESRAGQIQDPVQRLRYLQTSMGSLSGQPLLHASTKSRRMKRFAALGLALLLGGILIPKYKASSSVKAPAPLRPIAPTALRIGADVSTPDAIRADTAFVMTNLLRGVVQRGTGAAAAALNWPLGGKTGTTDDYGDAWFIGHLLCW